MLASSTTEPVAPSRTARIIALLDAAADALPWDVTLAESYAPGTAATVKLWAEARGYEAVDRVFAASDHDPHVSLHVQIADCCRIVVLGYRTPTDEEIEIEQARQQARRLLTAATERGTTTQITEAQP